MKARYQRPMLYASDMQATQMLAESGVPGGTAPDIPWEVKGNSQWEIFDEEKEE